MEIVTTLRQKPPRHCPFLNIECQGGCPAWIGEMEDCLFRVCLTEVEESFLDAARFLDRALGAPDGTGFKQLTDLRKQLKGGGSPEDSNNAVKRALGDFVTTGIFAKIRNMSLSQIAGVILDVEDSLSFRIGDLWSKDTEDL